MKIAFVTECDYDMTTEGVKDCDLIIFPFYMKETVSYNREIKGTTNFFKTLTGLSRTLKATVIAGVDTDSYGNIRHSAAVCDCGRLLGISDMTIVPDNEKYIGGGSLRVYDTKAGRIGLAVGGDAFSSECIRTLSSCGADYIVHIADPIEDGNAQISARAKAYEFGVPIAVCARGNAMLAAADGRLVFGSPQKITAVNLKIERDYHIITLRKRGKSRRRQQ